MIILLLQIILITEFKYSMKKEISFVNVGTKGIKKGEFSFVEEVGITNLEIFMYQIWTIAEYIFSTQMENSSSNLGVKEVKMENFPISVSITEDGNIIVGNWNNGVQIFNSVGKYLYRCQEVFTQVWSVKSTKNGNILVSEEKQILKFDTNGIFISKFGDALNLSVEAIGVDGNGNILADKLCVKFF